MVDMENVGTRLRQLRTNRGDTQLALAEIAGVTKQAISKIENKGVIDPASTTLEPIARRYGVNLRWLTTGEGPKYLSGQPSHAARLDPVMLSQTYRALNNLYKKELRRPFSLEEDPVRFVLAYEIRSQMSAEMTDDEKIELGAKLIDIVFRKGDEGDERFRGRDDGEPPDGSPSGSVARRVQRSPG